MSNKNSRWTLDRLMCELHTISYDVPELIQELKQMTGTHCNNELFKALSVIMGCRRESMHRWMTNKGIKRKPTNQTRMHLRLIVLLLRNREQTNYELDGRFITRRIKDIDS